MKEMSWSRRSLAATAFLLALTTVACAEIPSIIASDPQPAQTTMVLNPVRFQLYCPNAITQNFPIKGVVVTTWLICWHEVAGHDSIANPNGLVIGPVYFRKAPNAPLVRILWDMRVSDYFVPYHPGNPRFYDLSFYNFMLAGVTTADCPINVGGAPISSHVCKEVHDRGLMWKVAGGVHRGEEMILWGAIDAANYRYIQEYTFRDDGVIIGRMGATGQNLPGDELAAHVHNAIWRIDIDLDGTANSASHVQHVENPASAAGTASDITTPVPVAQGVTWSARTHDAVEVTNPSFKNAQSHVSSYQLIPLVTGGGLTQHYEKFTRNDFWVTPYNPTQFAAKNLPIYAAGQPVVNTDIVVWYKGSLHHHPRDEDGIYDQKGIWVGTADAMWTGFMLVPHDLFDCSPFFKPCP